MEGEASALQLELKRKEDGCLPYKTHFGIEIRFSERGVSKCKHS
jgi:hypothetical protein